MDKLTSGAAVIAVLNPKGGAGKSTIAIHLARALQLGGARRPPARVLIIDADPQGTARDWRRQAGEPRPGTPRLPVVLAVDRPVLEHEIPELRPDYDFVVIDGAARLEELLASACSAADLVLVPVQPSAADLWAARPLVELVRARQRVAGGRPAARAVISRAIVGTVLAAEARAAAEALGLGVLAGGTCQRVAYAEALASGSTVLDAEPGGRAAAEVHAIAGEVYAALFNGAKSPTDAS